ncbi:hypothetical protein LINPERPRIM_LOCUS30485, partial [Linum perenne]
TPKRGKLSPNYSPAFVPKKKHPKEEAFPQITPVLCSNPKGQKIGEKPENRGKAEK